MDPFVELARALSGAGLRFVVIGVWAANYYAPAVGALFRTFDQDVLLPPEPEALLRTWEVCEGQGLEIRSGSEPLDRPRDLALARRVIELRGLTTATDGERLHVDLALEMAGYGFEDVWEARRIFVVDGVELPVARLEQIVRSKQLLGRPKDELFLATHAEALRSLLGDEP